MEESWLPFTHISPVVTSCITIEKNQSQEIDFDTVHPPYSQLTSFTCTYLCVYLVLCIFITCIDLCDHHHSQDTTVTSQDSPMLPPSLPPFLTSGNQ